MTARRTLVTLAAALVACTSVPNTAPPSPSLSASPSPRPPTDRPRPAKGTFTFAVIGDWGAGTSEQRSIAQRLCSVRARAGFDTVVTTGDNFYDPDGTATDQNFHEPSACLIRAGITWRASWGNHDARGSDTRDVLGARRWYRWRAGSVQFFMLDSNDPGDPDQLAWLSGSLRSSRAPVKIAVFHHPPFTVGSVHDDNEDVQRHWVPLFERHGVDLVLSGHNHLYEHQVVAGIDYVVSGGGGRALYGCEGTRPTLRRCTAVHHFLVVTVGPARITVEAMDASGARVDRFVIRHAKGEG